MTIRIWNGRVEAYSAVPVNTGLNFREGAQVTIVSTGWAKLKADDERYGPCGRINQERMDNVAPEEKSGALLVKTGKIYHSVGGGLLNWTPPTDDNVEFVYNHTLPGYDDSQGGFDVTMQYDDEDLIG